MLIWTAIGFTVASLMKSKASWYLLSTLPPVVVLGVRFLLYSRPGSGDRVADVAHTVMLWSLLALAPSLVLDADALIALREGPLGFLAHPALGAVIGAAVGVLAVRTWTSMSALDAEALGSRLNRIVLALFLLAQLGAYAKELLRDRPAMPGAKLAQVAIDAADGRPAVVVWLELPFHAHPAGYFLLGREASVTTRNASSLSPAGLDQASADQLIFVLAPAALQLPPALADRLTRVAEAGDLALMRFR